MTTNAIKTGRTDGGAHARTARRRAATWVRYNWWKTGLHALLLTLGLVNLYPFFWMVGSSFKAEAEASTERLSPMPVTKFKLADGFNLAAVLPRALADGVADGVADGDGRGANSAARARLRRTLLLLADLQGKPRAIGAKEAANLLRIDLEAAAGQLADAETMGLVVRDRPSADGESLYRLTAGAHGSVTADGLRPRQILTLWSMQDENERRGETRATFADDCRSIGDYASEHGIADPATARAELDHMARLGYLVDGTLQAMNYWVVLKGENFLLRTLTTLIVTACCVVGTILISSMLGYALARLRFPGKLLVLGVMIGSSVLPGEARIIPIFKMLMAMGIMQNLWGMTLWLTSFGVGNALLMAGFFLTLPKEVDEAAQMDGAGVFRTFFDIALPMARPIVMTVGLFAFLTAWNNFMVPLLCTLSRPSMQPLAVAVYTFQQGHPGKWHEINAAAAIMTIPVIVLFLCVQKHVVKGIAVGAVKG